MNDFPESRHRATHGHRTGGNRMVRIRITLSALYPSAHRDVETRLDALLESAGITSWMTERRLTLVRSSHALSPAEWSAVIGWLLCQPEVVFVAREYPVTRRSHAAR